MTGRRRGKSKGMFTITAKVGNLWTMEELRRKLDSEVDLSYSVVDSWTLTIEGEKGNEKLLGRAREIVESNFGYIDEIKE